MASNSYNQQDPPRKHDPCKCEEHDSATKKSLGALIQVYCQAKDAAESNQEVATKDFEQKEDLFQEKKKTFMWTERNYRIYRDIDIVVDTRLQATNDTFKTNVATYNTESTALYTQLKNILAAIKDVKTKVSALRDQASNLDNFRNDQCNAGQWALLTGKNVENCKPDPNGPPIERPEACKDAEKIYNELIHVPKKCLVFDVDYLVSASADVIGIQTFSNIASLTPLQGNLADASKALITAIQTAANTRKGELTTLQADLITAMTDATVSGINKFTAISDCDAAYSTLEFFCKPWCDCVVPRREDVCEPRLKKCECEICEICTEVKNTYCEADKKSVHS
ncbi:MAG TPA: hypothetical protein VHE34_29970 [Puia sp.]|uniref:hypothetical protein n=1 Tax=Puia sp. TaxID=2045100 RepID=UPI002BD21E99|nr:hypothetical protein [Puia sp.]HVU99500.1 hypothetical protein [Puia sp.]